MRQYEGEIQAASAKIIEKKKNKRERNRKNLNERAGKQGRKNRGNFYQVGLIIGRRDDSVARDAV